MLNKLLFYDIGKAGEYLLDIGGGLEPHKCYIWYLDDIDKFDAQYAGYGDPGLPIFIKKQVRRRKILTCPDTAKRLTKVSFSF